MEYTELKKQIEKENEEKLKSQIKKRDLKDLLFLILLVLAIGALIVCIILIVRYEQMFTNPLGYSLNHFGIDYCTYFKDGNYIIINATK